MLAWGHTHELLTLPCGKCIGCRLKRAAEWALRCMHESLSYEKASFITLTYDAKHIPTNRSLQPQDLTNFLKRLRIDLARKHGLFIRFFACGEYGELRSRPHYHAIIYGWDFPDRQPTPNNPQASEPLYTSEQLTRLWGLGNATLGTVTSKSCAYVARYTFKKETGKKAETEYEQTNRLPPYNVMSKGIGKTYFNANSADMYPSDYLVSHDDYHKAPIPRYYDKLYQQLHAAAFDDIKRERARKAFERLNPADNTEQRLADREACVTANIRALKRNYEQTPPPIIPLTSK